MKYLLVLLLLLISCGQGAQGPAGSQGPPGTNPEIVLLCPGSTKSPKTSLEVGFCVEDQLYAIYGSNGFESLILPGNYSSKSCKFTVKENCVIIKGDN